MGRPILSQPSNKHNKIIAWLTGLLTLLLALFSFILSFNALTGLATEHGISIPVLFPLVVEAGVVIFSLNALYRSIQGESARRQWGLIIGSSLLAGVFNILHARPDLVSRVMAAMPSLFLLLSFESFLNQIKHSVKRSNLIRNIEQLDIEYGQKHSDLETDVQSKQKELNDLTNEANRLADQIEQAKCTLEQLQAEIKQAKRVQDGLVQVSAKQSGFSIEQRRAELIDILNSEGDLGPTTFAQRLNISRGTVYSDLKALHTAGLIAKNGDGWEVIV